MAEPQDWRSEQTERELNRLDRRGFAWEFLRRNPDYRRAFLRERIKPSGGSAASHLARSTAPQWGLHFPA